MNLLGMNLLGRNHFGKILDRATMLEHMLASDAALDGRFVTGVMTTGIYCLPSCRAKKPKPENVEFFERPEQAAAAGLRPCKRCRPDDFYRHHDPDEVLIEGLVARLRRDPAAFGSVAEIAAAAGIGTSKLGELCRRHFHTTAWQLLQRARIERSCQQLLTTDRAIADIAFAMGYETLSTFNERFRTFARMSPTAYRRLTSDEVFEITLPQPFQHQRLLRYVGRDHDSVSERVAGRTIGFTTWAADRPLAVTIELRQRTARCKLDPPLRSAAVATAVHRRVLGLLGLEIDPSTFERRMSRAQWSAVIAGRRGLSLPQAGGVFEGLVWVIAGQQVSLPVAYAMRRRLTGKVGQRLTAELWAPPTPAAVAELELDELRALGFSQRKSEYLSAIARAIVEGSLVVERLHERPATALERTLLEVRGLGLWSVRYLLMRTFAFADCVPVGDVALARSLKRFFALDERPVGDEMERLMSPFAPYRSLATFHFWALLENSR